MMSEPRSARTSFSKTDIKSYLEKELSFRTEKNKYLTCLADIFEADGEIKQYRESFLSNELYYWNCSLSEVYDEYLISIQTYFTDAGVEEIIRKMIKNENDEKQL
jgi:hypothetical protein